MPITSPTDFICKSELAVGTVKLVEVPTWDFHDHIVQRGLEEGTRGSRDGVGQLVQVIPDGELGRNLRDGITRRLGSQGR